MVAAVWRARRVPYIHGEVAYYLCEGALHPTKSEYDYWHLFGLAGMVLKPHLRSRLGFVRTESDLLAQLFNPEPTFVSEEEIPHGI